MILCLFVFQWLGNYTKREREREMAMVMDGKYLKSTRIFY